MLKKPHKTIKQKPQNKQTNKKFDPGQGSLYIQTICKSFCMYSIW